MSFGSNFSVLLDQADILILFELKAILSNPSSRGVCVLSYLYKRDGDVPLWSRGGSPTERGNHYGYRAPARGLQGLHFWTPGKHEWRSQR